MPDTPTLEAGKILDTLGSLRNSLTPSARRITDCILANPAQTARLSIAELSQEAGAGEASIIRFCRSLGFKGFQDFKLDLAIEVASLGSEEKSLLDTDVTEEDSAEIIGQKLQATINNVLSETLNLVNFRTLETVAADLKSARRIVIFGVGSSGITADEAKNKLMRIGFDVDALTNNHFMYMRASLLEPGDIAIGISHSGTSMETIKALTLASEAGATTIALTHNPMSDIAKAADKVLVNGNRQGKLQGDSIGTKISQLFVLDLLYTLLVQADPERAKLTKSRTTAALD
ncbi:MurR/RpiR family transcriptional regulator [Parasalinivibrio latis]|uniref:MurR/RpiR family transcriptional regulator n=1 Tax=Parasalinivibrio latis TaxID=2952610 RepID=UPI0030E4ED24